MQTTPKSLRLHIGLFGRRNVGKSSLLNAITRQQVSIVSAFAGTTTDPVEKPMELLPLGPVLFVDTAGVDDEGALGELRIERTKAVFDRVDLGVIVTEAGAWGAFEEGLLEELKSRKVPVLVVLNKADLQAASPEEQEALAAKGTRVVVVSASTGTGILDVREGLLRLAPADFFDNRRLVADLVPPGEVAVLVVPVDKEAPKGRLILPQVMTIRDLLDGEAMSLVCQERELRRALDRLKTPPALVVTDSQAFLKVAADVPREVPMTSFSILMSRFQGELTEQVRGTLGIEKLKGGRPDPHRRDLRPPSRGGGHRPGEDPPLAHPVRGGQVGVRAHPGQGLPPGPQPLQAHHPLRQLHREPPGDAEPHPPGQDGGGSLHQLRPHHRLLAGHLRARPGALPGGGDPLKTK